MTRSLVVLILLLQGCTYTVPLGTEGDGRVNKSQVDKLTESGDYQTYPDKVITPVQKGFYKMKAEKQKPECNSAVTPGSASNFSNCR